MSMNVRAFLCVRAGEHKSVTVDARYLAGRHAVLLPRFAMTGEQDEAEAIGLEYGQADEIDGDLVIGTTEQLGRLRALFESCRADEATDPEAVAFWASLIRPLDDAVDSEPAGEQDPAFRTAGWLAWNSSGERLGALPIE